MCNIRLPALSSKPLPKENIKIKKKNKTSTVQFSGRAKQSMEQVQYRYDVRVWNHDERKRQFIAAATAAKFGFSLLNQNRFEVIVHKSANIYITTNVF